MVVICDKPYPEDQEEIYKKHFEKFPFPLSDFQKYSIQALVEGNHTLVTAATGNGKTISAEFAIQYFVQQCKKKIIYTCPIKSLSNQKFYDFSLKYPDIKFGIFTGDIKYNPTADVIFATAEILMNHLFALKEIDAMSSDIIPDASGTSLTSNKQLHFQIDIHNELACVVMDECHFILDQDRGHVWENTILMLPPHIQMVLLSATLDQPEKFARFCERNGDIICNTKEVVWSSTLKRIVPLTHYGYMTTNESIFKKVRDKETQALIRRHTNCFIPLKVESGMFQEQGYLNIKSMKNILDKNEVFMKRSHVLNTLAKTLVDQEMLPALVFTFSRKNVEEFAKEITTNLLEFDSKVPYTIEREAEAILRSKLSNYQEYLQMPDYRILIQLLEKGIGIHHSGMIPIFREIVEFMISKKYIKMLFATDSFSIGLNCEIRTVVFTSLQKFDGNLEQYLQPHAYTQMAGRAGRRNIDTVGHVVHCNNLFSLPSSIDYKTILCGKPQKMESKFYISFSMVLSLIRNGKLNTNDFIDFAEHSLLQMDMNDKKVRLLKNQQDVFEKIQTLNTKLMPFLKTPRDVIRQYMEYKRMLPTLVNKKRKDTERHIQTIMELHKDCIVDVERFEGLTKLEQELEDINNQIQYIDNFVNDQVNSICSILLKYEFIERSENGSFQFTPKGHFASQIGEVHPLIMTDVLFKTLCLENMSPIQLISIQIL